MDEAQELCDKIAIMINGRFVIFGSPNYLMEAYGLGYMFTITVNSEAAGSLDAAKATIQQKIPGAQFIDHRLITENGAKNMWTVNYRVLNVMGGRTANANAAQAEDNLILSEFFKRLTDLCDPADANGLTAFDVTRTNLVGLYYVR
jgi:ABC-type multidrug transport system ATPase subunit